MEPFQRWLITGDVTIWSIMRYSGDKSVAVNIQQLQTGILGKKCVFSAAVKPSRKAKLNHSDRLPTSAHHPFLSIHLNGSGSRAKVANTGSNEGEPSATKFAKLWILLQVLKLTSGNISASSRREMRQEKR